METLAFELVWRWASSFSLSSFANRYYFHEFSVFDDLYELIKSSFLRNLRNVRLTHFHSFVVWVVLHLLVLSRVVSVFLSLSSFANSYYFYEFSVFDDLFGLIMWWLVFFYWFSHDQLMTIGNIWVFSKHTKKLEGLWPKYE